MTQTSNQFGMLPEKGMPSYLEATNVLNCRVDSSESGTLTPGAAVKIKDIAGDQITVELAADDADDILGFVHYNVKTASYVADEMVKIAIDGTIMNMEASAAIAAGANVETLIAGAKILTVTNVGSRIIGKALKKATADGDLIPVLIKTPTNDLVA